MEELKLLEHLTSLARSITLLQADLSIAMSTIELLLAEIPVARRESVASAIQSIGEAFLTRGDDGHQSEEVRAAVSGRVFVLATTAKTGKSL